MFYYIYQITNIITRKRYIGQTYKPERRLNEHFYNARRHKNDCSKLYCAIRTYGESNFKMKILCKLRSKQLADKMEIALIRNFDTRNDEFGYNITFGGDGLGFGSNHPNFGKKMPGRREWMIELNRRQVNPMQDAAIIEKHWKGDKHPYHRQNSKVKEAGLANFAKLLESQRVKVEQYRLDGKYIKTYNSINEAAKAINRSPSSLNDAINNNTKCANFKWIKIKN